MWRRAAGLAMVLAVVLCPRRAGAYGILSHEAVIDAVWSSSIAPILRARYHPSAAALQRARAFAYGGSLVQDIGYYPFSSRFYGDLTHYVRAGDFVAALVRDSRNVDDLAFALGALAHYAADSDGHPRAINPSVSLIFPKLRAKYGPAPTYEDDPTAHVRTEFAFDVVEVARGDYVPQAYHDFIGFQVDKPLLERAFRETYGLEIADVFTDFDLAVGTFRFTVSTAVGLMTKDAWDVRRQDIERLHPGVVRNAYLFRMPRTDFEHEWGTDYRRPGLWHRFVGFLVRLLPKIGPLRALAFKAPTPEAERLFLASFRDAVERYRALLDRVSARDPRFADLNFDTGRPAKAGDYRLADDAYAKLVEELSETKFAHVTPALRSNLLAFFAHADLAEPAKDDGDQKAWRELPVNLETLRARSK